MAEGAGEGVAVPVAHEPGLAALPFTVVMATMQRIAAIANRQPAMIFTPEKCARMVIRPIPFVRLFVFIPALIPFGNITAIHRIFLPVAGSMMADSGQPLASAGPARARLRRPAPGPS